MKKFFVLLTLISLCFYLPVKAEEFSTGGDMWDNFSDQNTYGQKPVTDEEFDKALTKKKIKKNFWGKEIKNKNIPKGEEYKKANFVYSQVWNTQNKNFFFVVKYGKRGVHRKVSPFFFVINYKTILLTFNFMKMFFTLADF